MGRELPSKVQAGQVVSAAWLNSVVDYLRYLNEQQLRRRILRGAGYAARESAGGTTLTIDRQPDSRVVDDGLDLMRNEDFQVRVKPKGLSEVDEAGNWEKVVQVHKGTVTDHNGNTLEVKELRPKTEEKPPVDAGVPQAWDAGDWVDIGKLTAGPEGKTSYDIYVRVDGNFPTEAVFVTEKPAEPDGLTYIHIGRIYMILGGEESLPRVYLSQFHQGPIEMGGGGGGIMPFDVSLVPIEVPNPDGPQFPSVSKSFVKIEGGRVYLPDARYATIPTKDPKSGGSRLEAQAGYVVLTVSYSSSGEMSYRYRILSSMPGTPVTPTEK